MVEVGNIASLVEHKGHPVFELPVYGFFAFDEGALINAPVDTQFREGFSYFDDVHTGGYLKGIEDIYSTLYPEGQQLPDVPVTVHLDEVYPVVFQK